MKYDFYYFRTEQGKIYISASTRGCGCCSEYYSEFDSDDDDYKPTVAEVQEYINNELIRLGKLQANLKIWAEKDAG